MPERIEKLKQPDVKDSQLRTKEDSNLFVPPDKEEEYCKAHHIELRRLPNGIVLISATRQVEDIAYAEIRFNFPTGSYFDPPGKTGIHHLFEHLISKVPLEQARRYRAYYNAETSTDELNVLLDGVANYKVKDIGIWPVLPSVYQQLAEPIKTIGNLDQTLEIEKMVVFGEINESQADHGKLVSHYENTCLFDATNPFRIKPLGTKADLESITINDVKEAAEKIFIPSGLFITIFNEGTVETGRIIADEIENMVTNFPRQNIEPQSVDKSLFERFNPRFNQGQIYTHDIGLKNNIVTLDFVWVFPNKEYTTSSFALNRYTDVCLNNKLFEFFRKEGLGYSSGAGTSQIGSNYDICHLALAISKRENIENYALELAAKLRQNVLMAIDDSQISNVADQEKKIQTAIPITAASRFNGLIEGLKNYGMIIDADEVERRYSNISDKDLGNWRDKFIETEPTIIIAGDLSKK